MFKKKKKKSTLPLKPCSPESLKLFIHFPSSIREWYDTERSSCQYSPCTRFLYRPWLSSPPARKMLFLFLPNSFCAPVPAQAHRTCTCHAACDMFSAPDRQEHADISREDTAGEKVCSSWSWLGAGGGRYLVLAFFLGCWLTGLPTVPFFTEPFRARSLCFSTKPTQSMSVSEEGIINLTKASTALNDTRTVQKCSDSSYRRDHFLGNTTWPDQVCIIQSRESLCWFFSCMVKKKNLIWSI